MEDRLPGLADLGFGVEKGKKAEVGGAEPTDALKKEAATLGWLCAPQRLAVDTQQHVRRVHCVEASQLTQEFFK